MNAPPPAARSAISLTLWRLGWALAVLLAGGCQPDHGSVALEDQAEVAPATSAATGQGEAGERRRGRVTIDGGEEAESASLWQPPLAQVAPGAVGQGRREAAAALARGHLYEDAEAAIPLYLAVLEQKPEDRAASAGLQRAIAALQAHARRVLRRADEDVAALQEAHALIAVLRTVAPDSADTAEFVAGVALADRLWALNAEAEDEIQAGRFGVQGGGALPALREALRLAPGQPRAMQGMAAVESGLIGRAEQAAEAGDFIGARRWLELAVQIRPGSPAVEDAGARIQIMRLRRIAHLRDAGLRILDRYDGVRKARDRLARILRIADPGDPAAAELRNAIDLATHYGRFRPGQVFSDPMKSGDDGPSMVVVPHGAFRMGAEENDRLAASYEKPARYIRFERGFAMSAHEITVGQFRRYLAVTHARTRSLRRGYSMPYDERAANFVRRSGVDTGSDYLGRRADDHLPVVHVSAADADGYARWLSGMTGHHYRLPSEAEFEYALRAGGSGAYPWGVQPRPPAGFGNLTGDGDRSPGGRVWDNAFIGYGDGHWGPAPVGSFRVNAFGLYDMSGNVNEWVADCWHDSYQRAPKDAQPWYNPGCRIRVIRGGAWSSASHQFRSTWRAPVDVDTTNAQIGFRVVRDL